MLTDKEIQTLRDNSVVKVVYDDRDTMVVRIAQFTRLGIYAYDVALDGEEDNYPHFFYYGDILEIITR